MIFLLILFASTLVFARRCPPLERDVLLPCVMNLLDANHDGDIVPSEVDTFILAQDVLGENACFKALQGQNTQTRTNGTIIVHFCDVNQDGKLNVAHDWNAPGSCIKENLALQQYVCELCYACGALHEAEVKKNV